MAFEAGTTKAEPVEFLNVAITESGCPGEQWAMKSPQAFKDLENDKHIEADICCNETNEMPYGKGQMKTLTEISHKAPANTDHLT